MADSKSAAGRVTFEGNNRRATVRFRRSVPQAGRAFIANSSTAVPAQVMDISQGGIGLILDDYVAPETLVRVEMGDDGKHVLVEMLANVANVTELEGGRWRCGCEWLRKLTDEELTVLKGP
jgi:hypothetical protein